MFSPVGASLIRTTGAHRAGSDNSLQYPVYAFMQPRKYGTSRNDPSFRPTQKRMDRMPWMLPRASRPATSEINLPVVPASPSSLLLADGMPALEKMPLLSAVPMRP